MSATAMTMPPRTTAMIHSRRSRTSGGAYTAVRGSIHCGHSLEHTLWSQPGAYTGIHCGQREHTLRSEGAYPVVTGSIPCGHSLEHTLWSEGAYTVVRGSIHCSHREHTLQSQGAYTAVTGSISVL